MDRGSDRTLLCGQRVGQDLAVWIEGLTDPCNADSVGQALSVWTEGWRGSFCVDRVGQDLACCVDRGSDRLLLCGQRVGQDLVE